MRSALLIVLAAIAACAPPPASESAPPPVPQVKLHGVRLRYFRGGELIASGTARELTYLRATSEFAATDVALRLPDREGGLEVRAPASTGVLSARQADCGGGVVLTTGSGLVGKTPRAHFDGAASSASGSDEVLLEGTGYQLSSRGFAIDFATDRFSFAGGVKSRFGSAR